MDNSQIYKKIFVVISILLFYRFGVNVTSPFINYENIDLELSTVSTILSKFTGGASTKFSIFSLGVLPYITGVIAIHVFSLFVPYYKSLRESGGMGQLILNKHILIFTVILSFAQSYGFIKYMSSTALLPIVDGNFNMIGAALSMTTGTLILVYLSTIITKYGIGNGITLLITCSIVSSMYSAGFQMVDSFETGAISKMDILLFIFGLILSLWIVSIVEDSIRKIPVINKSSRGTNSYHPLKVSISGIMPVIVVYMLFGLIIMLSTYLEPVEKFFNIYLARGTFLYYVIFVTFTFVFAYLYTLAISSPKKIADDFKEKGLFVSTIPQGKKTEEYLKKVILTLIFYSSVYLILISFIVDKITNLTGVGATIAGTSLVILVMFSVEVKNQFKVLLTNKKYKKINKDIEEVF